MSKETPASMLHGETIGSLTSSEPWSTAGANDKSAAVDEMRAAKEAAGGSTTQNPTVAKVEKAVGGAVGCEGMVEEGKEAGVGKE
ncbi:hypothetical protein MMC14_001702 [Varicellaria rhodocarpa]|nr:hypothetical protein [Varicellaria rhodocarpa]